MVPFQMPALSLFPSPYLLECSFSFLSELRARFTAFLFTVATTIVLWNSSIQDLMIMTQQVVDLFKQGDLPPSQLCSNHPCD